MGITTTMTGRIERRLLVNLRVDPEAAAAHLPAPLRPLEVDGWALAGVCLLRLTELRPQGLPAWSGATTENAAHRIAVEWDEDGHRRRGVWIPGRHSSSPATVRLGGRLFPAVHERARFTVEDGPDELRIAVADRTGPVASVSCEPAAALPADSVFPSLGAAGDLLLFGGVVGLSPSLRPGRADVVALDAPGATLAPVALTEAHVTRFARWWPGATWDSAFILRDLPCTWTGRIAALAVTPSPTGSHPGGPHDTHHEGATYFR